MLYLIKKWLGITAPNPLVPQQEPLESRMDRTPSAAPEPKPIPAEPDIPSVPVPTVQPYQSPGKAVVNPHAHYWFDAMTTASSTMILPVLWSAGNQPRIRDLADLKSVLITGAAASGKTNYLHQLILPLLTVADPVDVKFIFLDGQGLELNMYQGIEKTFAAKLPGRKAKLVVKDATYVLYSLQALAQEITYRLNVLSKAGVRDRYGYLTKMQQPTEGEPSAEEYMPNIVVAIDDISGFQVERAADLFEPLIQILTTGYKVGIYLVATTNQATGHALPAEFTRLIQEHAIFRLSLKEDYRRFLGTTKFEIPLERGSFLFKEMNRISIGQAININSDEITAVVQYIHEQVTPSRPYLLPDTRPLHEQALDFPFKKDPLFEEVAKLVIENQVGSTSLIQRRLKLGYNRAGKLMDQLEAAGVVGPSLGSKAREVYIKSVADLNAHLKKLETDY